jgi:hypothetical protein
MPTQYQIEKAAGIDGPVAQHMMAEKTPAARNAMSLLKMCVDRFENGAFGLLKASVDECKRELLK